MRVRRRTPVLVRVAALAAVAIGVKRVLLLHPPFGLALASSFVDILIIGLAVAFVAALD
jgi:hypothetical protein